MIIRRALLACTIGLLTLPWTLASAQNDDDRNPNQQQQQRRMAMLAQRLNLSKEQKQQWLQIQRETAQKVRTTRKDDSLSEAQMQARLREIHKEQKERVMTLLTPEQQDEIKAFWEEQKQKQQNKGSDGKNGDAAGPSSQNNSADQEEDLFAGMVSDDPPPAQRQPANNTNKKNAQQ